MAYVKFGLPLSAEADPSVEADVVISRTTGQADFTVSLTWHKPPSGEAGAGAAGTAG
ncbi:hypothetical protein SLNWT_4906 [Streptomyces albus]|uniref:Trypsin-co-occurring domain-containing protein n=1 Tax=Streptomyces albus (strain ATCC 21838 / DSM 41398 / FERM P-419 / JCM 4703 / NBRC 107858) TaxID=1081613 RepID=A0A0B5F4N5_STRA4|nr:hypothetical protein SLNWT_4906 [Streptomyces albus]AOU79589.1 hypothetical protein SLNHY_4898 [Streptomyces albus]AYN35312.1 hypothetical protein DUI70_4814 [Streptomyces albus]